MKNGWLHSWLVAQVVAWVERRGATARQEAPAPGGGFIDVLVTLIEVRLAVEVEVSTPRRAAHGVGKAIRARCTGLLVVTPTRGTAQIATRSLARTSVPGLRQRVVPYGLAECALAQLLNAPRETKNQ